MVKKLGGGSFGTVYLVQKKNSKERMAAKHQSAKHAKDMRYIRRELDILQMLRDGESIVTFYDYFESSNQGVILTEFIMGGELFERISSKEYNLTERKCKEFVKQVYMIQDDNQTLTFPPGITRSELCPWPRSSSS